MYPHKIQLLTYRNVAGVFNPPTERSLFKMLTTRFAGSSRGAALVAHSTGPGTGKRHFPIASEPRTRMPPPGPAEHFDLLSAAEMEAKFAEWIHASTPPAIDDREPPGVTALREWAGHRRPPSPTDPRGLASPPLPYPTTGPAADLQRDLKAKSRIIPS